MPTTEQYHGNLNGRDYVAEYEVLELAGGKIKLHSVEVLNGESDFTLGDYKQIRTDIKQHEGTLSTEEKQERMVGKFKGHGGG